MVVDFREIVRNGIKWYTTLTSTLPLNGVTMLIAITLNSHSFPSNESHRRNKAQKKRSKKLIFPFTSYIVSINFRKNNSYYIYSFFCLTFTKLIYILHHIKYLSHSEPYIEIIALGVCVFCLVSNNNCHYQSECQN